MLVIFQSTLFLLLFVCLVQSFAFNNFNLSPRAISLSRNQNTDSSLCMNNEAGDDLSNSITKLKELLHGASISFIGMMGSGKTTVCIEKLYLLINSYRNF